VVSKETLEHLVHKDIPVRKELRVHLDHEEKLEKQELW